MVAIIDDENPPIGIDEQYSSAIVSSNLRMVDHGRRPIDLILAAGMNPHRLGMALRRLESEWHSTSHPILQSAKQIEALARTFAVEPKDSPYAGMVRVSADIKGRFGREAVDVGYVLPLVLAKRTANAWHAHDLGLLFQQLKTLPEVRAALVYWAEDKGIDDGIHIAGKVLMWWLSPKCRVCAGVKLRVVQGTGRLSSKLCKACRGTGEADPPHGMIGLKMLAHIRECVGRARKGLAGRFKHQAQAQSQVADRCRAILAANPNDQAARATLDGLMAVGRVMAALPKAG